MRERLLLGQAVLVMTRKDMRRAHPIAITLTLLLPGCVTADIGAGEGPRLEEIDYQADNGIFLDNGLNLANGMNLGNGTSLSNGMNLGNGIDLANGMNLGNGIYAPPAGSGLEQWIDVEPPMRKKILRYLVECALPAGVTVQLRYRGVLETLGAGVVGLGPGLQTGLMPTAEQEKVTGCLLARVNAHGIPVSIDLFGPMTGLSTATSSEVAAYPVAEGAFFGNVFLATPQAYACSMGSLVTRSEFRACSSTTCGVLRVLTNLNKEGNYATKVTLKDCFRDLVCTSAPLVDGASYARSCTWYGHAWAYPMTTRLATVDAGEECFASYLCEPGLECTEGACW
jgi:hypothetical protein